MRIKSLDSIRGIAAFIVLLGHCYISSQALQDDINTAIIGLELPFKYLVKFFVKFITAGRSGVILFFVLSGFVLTLSLLRKKQTYKEYLLSRFFRLYPVLFISIIISYISHIIIGYNSTSWFSGWYQSYIAKPIPLSFNNLLGHLALTGISKEHIFLNNPVWSLVYEARISIVFPFMLLLLMKKNKWIIISLGFLISLLSTLFLLITTDIAPKGYMEKTFIDTLATTGYYCVFFLIGILLALKHEQTQILVHKFPITVKILLLILSVCCFIYTRDLVDFNSLIIDYFHMVGAVIIIALSAGWNGLANFLCIPVFLWLGRVSYSLYLTHWIILYSVFELFGDRLNYLEIITIIITVSLIFAELIARFVEYPCISLGKSLLNKKLQKQPS